jgi:hypothetical protein
MASKVYYMDDRSASAETSLVAKMINVYEAAGLNDLVRPGDVVAIKIHCGEYNNTAYLRPVYARALVDHVKELGGRPFVCDTTTQPYNPYSSRVTALDLMLTAERNGYNSGTLGCPFIPADGYLGTDDTRVDLPEGLILKEAYIAKAIALADAVICLTHFKGHGVGVYGGAVKNLGIGCQSKRGKYNVHQAFHSRVSLGASAFFPHLCRGKACPTWEACETSCSYGLIKITETGIEWTPEGCANCLAHLKVVTCGAIQDPPDNHDMAAAAMGDAALGVVKAVGAGKMGYINMAIDIAPFCDCVMFSDRPLVPNVGVFASTDPVAIDQVCIDMVQTSAGMSGSRAHDFGVAAAGVNKFSAASSAVGASEALQVAVGARNGLGSREYELIQVPVGDPVKPRFHWDKRPVGVRLAEPFRREKVYPDGGYVRNEEFDLELVR